MAIHVQRSFYHRIALVSFYYEGKGGKSLL